MNESHDAAERYLRSGYAPIPVPFKSKNPNRDGWQHLRLTADDLPRYFNDIPQNVGLLCGEPSGGLVDVDCDAPEAISIAASYLPATEMRHGRVGKPQSHYWYRTTGTPPATEQYRDVHGTMLIEMRSTGAHTIVPPSIHPDGDSLAWEADGEPSPVDGGELARIVGRIAAAALIARHWPQGSRHDAALALAGVLLRHGDTLDEAMRFVGAVCRAAGDEETQGRLRDVATTRDRLAAGRETTGLPTLRGLLGDAAVDKLVLWLGLENLPPADAATGASEEQSNDEAETGGGSGRPSQASRLVALAADADLFHDPAGETYATFPVDDHLETYPTKAKAFRLWLIRRYYINYRAVPGNQAVADALSALAGQALFTGPCRAVHVRLAEHDGRVYLDLCDTAWRVVEIGADGWRIVADPPVRFRRTKGMLALPAPVAGGTIAALRPFLNVATNDAFVLIVAWLIAAFRPRGPYPCLNLHGEQGSAKTTAARVLRALVDPHTAPVRTLPRDERDLMLTATNNWLSVFDNVSGIPVWLSDALCRIATGGGFATRELYTDTDETVLDAQRPVALTGIEGVATRSDLLDRTILIDLPRIPDARRRTERAFWQEFEAARPAILGALLTAVSAAIRNVGSTHLPALPRLADFAVWATAAESGCGWEPGTFLRAYSAAREAANETAIEATPVGAAMLAFAAAHEEEPWRGTATALLRELERHADERTRNQKTWPTDGTRLSAALRRIAPNLRAAGVAVEFDDRTGKRRTITVQWVGKPASPASPASSDDDTAHPDSADGSPARDAGVDADDAARRAASPDDGTPAGGNEGSDAGDASPQNDTRVSVAASVATWGWGREAASDG